MSKTLLYTDLHIHNHKKSVDRLKDCLEVQKWVFETAINRGIKDIIFLGDLFHDRTKIEVLAYVLTYDLFEQYLSGEYDIVLWLLLGNHDLYHKEVSGVFSPKMLTRLPRLNIIDKPCSLLVGDNEIDFLPFTENPLDDLKLLASRPKPQGSRRTLCSHLAIDGAQLNCFGALADVIVEHDGDMVKVGTDKLGYWDKVWLGHYHGAQILENGVEYLGSPLQLTKSEAGQEKHIAIFDPATLQTEYIINDFSPVHLVLQPNQLDKHVLDRNFITLSIPPEMSQADVADVRKKILSETNVATLEIRHQKREDLELVVQDARSILLDENKMLETYVDQTKPSELDRNILLEVGKLVCQKTSEVGK